MKYLRILTALSFALVISIFSGNVFAQVDIARKTTAVTYPLDETVKVQFRGTTRFPRMKGDATVKRTKKNGSEVKLSISKMPRPFELGAGYATYVLWAISPDGQIDNLGEIKRRGFWEFDSNIKVTTPLQTFALIVTAEPHFLVKRPSQAIMLENLNPYAKSGRVISTSAVVEYFGNSSDFFRDARTPEIAEIDYSKTPQTILQARQAVALAKFAGAERDAADELKEAEDLLKSADDGWKAGRREEDVDVIARRSISTAVKAETTAIARRDAREKRNEKSRSDAEMREVENKYADAQKRIIELENELAGETKNRELSERDVANYLKQIRDLKDENARLRDELAGARFEVDTVKARLASIQREKQAADAQIAREERIRSLENNEPVLMENLKQFGSVTRNERGIVLTLPETFWSGIRSAAFAPNMDSRLSALGEVLSANPDYRITIESHTDSRGVPDELQSLTDLRSKTISDRLSVFGISRERIEARGLGASLPVSPNTTLAGRAKNRRVQMILVPTL